MKPTSKHIQQMLKGQEWRTAGVYCWAIHFEDETHFYIGSSANPKRRLSQHATIYNPFCRGSMLLRDFTAALTAEKQLANFEFALQFSSLKGQKLFNLEHCIAKGFALRGAAVLNTNIGQVGVPFNPDVYTGERITPSIHQMKGETDE